MTASPRCRPRGARPPRHGRLWRRGADRAGGAGISWRDRLLASDPGLNRLRVATHGAVGISASIGAERLLTLETGRPSNASLIAMLLGAVVAMQATLGLAGRTRGKLRVGLGFPVAMSVGLVAGSFVAGRGATPLVVFVVVQFAAVFVRRFGAPFFIYGFMGWVGYFFASFLNASVGELPRLVEDVAVASAVTVLLSMTLLRFRPETVLTRLLAAFDARGRAVAAIAADVLRRSAGGKSRPVPSAPDPLETALRNHLVRLTEAALMADAALADGRALPAGWDGESLRGWLLEQQLSIEQLATNSARLAQACAATPADCELAGRAAGVMRAAADGRLDDLRREADLLDTEGRSGTGAAPRLACRLAGAARHHASAFDLHPLTHRPPSRPAAGSTQPVVALTMGALPGSAGLAGQVAPAGRMWNPLRRADLVTRQASQAAVAAGLSIVAGRAVSEQRYYWAVIAAFVVFAGTATRSETVIKGANRIVGTLVGIFVSLAVADATVGNVPAVLLVIVISMFGALYLQQVSYAYMVFFITVMLGELYSVLDELSGGLLVLRLEETAVGAAIAVVVALVFLPVSTRETARAARAGFHGALHDLLECCACLLGAPPAGVGTVPAGARAVPAGARAVPAEANGAGCEPADLDAASRRLDLGYQQLELVLAPRSRSSLFGGDPELLRRRLGRYLLCTSSARELAIALRADPTQRPHLARACSALAAASAALAQPGAPGEGREPATALGEAADEVGRAAVLTELQTATLPVPRRGRARTAPAAVPVRGAERDDLVERAVVRLLLTMRALAGLDPSETTAGDEAPAPSPAGADPARAAER